MAMAKGKILYISITCAGCHFLPSVVFVIVILSVIIGSDFKLNVIMLSVISLNVAAPPLFDYPEKKL